MCWVSVIVVGNASVCKLGHISAILAWEEPIPETDKFSSMTNNWVTIFLPAIPPSLMGNEALVNPQTWGSPANLRHILCGASTLVHKWALCTAPWAPRCVYVYRTKGQRPNTSVHLGVLCQLQWGLTVKNKVWNFTNYVFHVNKPNCCEVSLATLSHSLSFMSVTVSQVWFFRTVVPRIIDRKTQKERAQRTHEFGKLIEWETEVGEKGKWQWHPVAPRTPGSPTGVGRMHTHRPVVKCAGGNPKKDPSSQWPWVACRNNPYPSIAERISSATWSKSKSSQ